MANGEFLSELGRRLPQIALGILAARQGGPQAAAAFQGGMLQRDQYEREQARQAQLDEERRQAQAAQDARAASAEERAAENQRLQKLQAALGILSRYEQQQGETALDPVAAENAMLGRASSLESMFGVPQGQLSGAIPNMAPAISARKKRLAKETYEQAEQLYGAEAMANDSITIRTEAFGEVKPSQLRGMFAAQAVTETGEPAKPVVPTPSEGVPTTERRALAAFARERGKTPDTLTSEEMFEFRRRYMDEGRAPRAAAGRGVEEGGLTPEGLDVAAWQYIQTGTMPPMGMGASSQRIAILNRAGELAGAGVNPQLNQALFKADSSALTQITRNLAGINAYKETARTNISVLKEQANKIAETGTPILNRPVRQIATMTGSPEMAAFNTALGALQPEIARILFNPNLTGVLTDSARQEAQQLLRGDYTVEQLLEAIRIVEIDMAAREKAMRAEQQTIEDRMRGRGPQGADATPGAVVNPFRPQP